MIVIELIAKEVISGPIKPNKASIGNVLACKLMMKSERAETLIEIVEDADPAIFCDLVMKSMTRI